MSILGDEIRKRAAYAGPSKAERSLWNAALEKAILVVDAELAKPQTSPQCFAPPISRKVDQDKGEE